MKDAWFKYKGIQNARRIYHVKIKIKSIKIVIHLSNKQFCLWQYENVQFGGDFKFNTWCQSNLFGMHDYKDFIFY